MRSVIILGGYGNFGKRIALALVKSGIAIIIAGRNADKAQALGNKLKKHYPKAKIRLAIFDAKTDLANQLQNLKPAIAINTIGPFQTSDYAIAKTCIQQKTHYIDLADGRDFVTGITALDQQARKADIAVISGASTVPGLSSAIVEKYKDRFSEIHTLKYGISPGQKAERGLATTRGILTYLGRPIKPAFGSNKTRYGWQDIYRQDYPILGKRWMANCDIPDLDLFPKKYNIKEIQFSAGMESLPLHLGIWLVSWLVRMGLPLNLPKHANFLLRLSHLFDWLGTDDGGLHMVIKGKDKKGRPHEIKWFIIAKDGDGPQIPTIPAIILAKKLASGELTYRGAKPCIGLVRLEEYLQELEGFNIKTFEILNFQSPPSTKN